MLRATLCVETNIYVCLLSKIDKNKRLQKPHIENFKAHNEFFITLSFLNLIRPRYDIRARDNMFRQSPPHLAGWSQMRLMRTELRSQKQCTYHDVCT